MKSVFKAFAPIFFLAVTSQAHASVIVEPAIGPLGDGDQISFGENIKGLPTATPGFTYQWNFSISESSFVLISESDTISRKRGLTSNPISGGELSLFHVGDPNVIAEVPILPAGSLTQSATLGVPDGVLLTSPGDYYFQILGNFSNPSSIVADITGSISVTSAVPEPSTWAMMLLGFLGVGFLAYRRKNGTLRLA